MNDADLQTSGASGCPATQCQQVVLRGQGERFRRFRPRLGRGAHPPRRERCRKVDAVLDPRRPVPTRLRRVPPSTVQPQNAQDAEGRPRRRGRHGVSALPPRLQPHGGGEPGARPRRPRDPDLPDETSKQKPAELGEEYGLPVDPAARIWQLSVGEQQRVEILKLLYRNATRADTRRTDRGADAPRSRAALHDDAADGGRGPVGDLRVAQAPRGESSLGSSDRCCAAARASASSHTRDTEAKDLARMMVGRDLVLPTREATRIVRRPSPVGA